MDEDKKKNLLLPQKSGSIALSLVRALRGIMNSILRKDSAVLQSDDAWVKQLIRWANKNNISYFRLPRDKQKLINLTELNLGRRKNKVSTLPDTIGNLVNLKELDLGWNKLSELPDTIGNLSNLTKLSLGNNKLSALPDTIGNLTNLTKLNLNGHKLSALPDTIGNLSNLTVLFLDRNNLSTLPDTIGNLSKLERLNLEDNNLSALPYTIRNLINLKWWDLSGNPVNKELPPYLSPHLRTPLLHISFPLNSPPK